MFVVMIGVRRKYISSLGPTNASATHASRLAAVTRAVVRDAFAGQSRASARREARVFGVVERGESSLIWRGRVEER